LKKDLIGSLDLSGHGILVGVDFADHLSLRVGDHLSIFSATVKKIQDALKNKTDYAALPDDYEVRGIFDTGYYDYDARVVITSIDNAQDLFDLDDTVHGLFVTLRDPYAAGLVAGELQKTLGDNYSIDTWMRDNSSMLTAVAVEKNVMFYLLFFIVLVAALCILSAQITFVIQKTREIGMLKALGASPWQISGIFLFQSSLIGVIGVTAGFGLGMLAVTYRNGFLHFLRDLTGLEIFPASVYGFDELPALITPSDVAVICVASFVICIFGGLLPAWRAGRLKPVEALRYE
jgi:lipoprotein-releasing system permease protein